MSPTTNKVTGFTCKCDPGWTGDRCQTGMYGHTLVKTILVKSIILFEKKFC